MKELFQRTKQSFSAGGRARLARVPNDLWVKCLSCRDLIYRRQLEENLKVCPRCGAHLRLRAREWLALLDEGSFEERDADLRPVDLLGFSTPEGSYAGKLAEAQARSGES
ncbi:MAG TPA: acetyl-CoA carboxylase carboxyl transferase subunit beta, partial [Roseiflexaceae bacterium]|nr:acetyl-CoA carboxylase carboxyl transferase subunit beta [Roseiflexaceae bacterium]